MSAPVGATHLQPDPGRRLVTAEFATWGTYVQLVCPGDVAAQSELLTRWVLTEVDRTCSRFRPASDLSRANARAGRWTEVDPLLVAAVAAAVAVAGDTAGLVTPLLGRSLVALGYDRDLEELRRSPSDTPRMLPRPTPDSWSLLRWQEAAVRVPTDTALDLGSIGKAWAADLVAGTIRAELGVPALVDIGGDIAVTGAGGWPVAVQEHPDAAQADQLVWLDGGGLATSSTRARRWTQAGATCHHVLDPRTGLPTSGPWHTVTATGPTCVAANAATTAALVLGEAAVPWLEERGVDARLVPASGPVRAVGRWPAQKGA